MRGLIVYSVKERNNCNRLVMGNPFLICIDKELIGIVSEATPPPQSDFLDRTNVSQVFFYY